MDEQTFVWVRGANSPQGFGARVNANARARHLLGTRLSFDRADLEREVREGPQQGARQESLRALLAVLPRLAGMAYPGMNHADPEWRFEGRAVPPWPENREVYQVHYLRPVDFALVVAYVHEGHGRPHWRAATSAFGGRDIAAQAVPTRRFVFRPGPGPEGPTQISDLSLDAALAMDRHLDGEPAVTPPYATLPSSDAQIRPGGEPGVVCLYGHRASGPSVPLRFAGPAAVQVREPNGRSYSLLPGDRPPGPVPANTVVSNGQQAVLWDGHYWQRLTSRAGLEAPSVGTPVARSGRDQAVISQYASHAQPGTQIDDRAADRFSDETLGEPHAGSPRASGDQIRGTSVPRVLIDEIASETTTLYERARDQVMAGLGVAADVYAAHDQALSDARTKLLTEYAALSLAWRRIFGTPLPDPPPTGPARPAGGEPMERHRLLELD